MIAPIGAQQTSLGVTSTETAAPFRHQVDRRVTYVCPATSIPTSTAVWGANNEYTFDSAVCVAAVHAEVLPLEQAGVVTFMTPVRVVCPRLGMFPHPLWGVDIYADESSLCAAAVHAGIIPNTGGTVTVSPSGFIGTGGQTESAVEPWYRPLNTATQASS